MFMRRKRVSEKTPEKTPDKYVAQRKYQKSNKETGLVRVSVWVPSDKRLALLDYAADCRLSPKCKFTG